MPPHPACNPPALHRGRQGTCSESGRDATICPDGAVLARQNDEWTESRRYMGQDILAACRKAGQSDMGENNTSGTRLTIWAIPGYMDIGRAVAISYAISRGHGPQAWRDFWHLGRPDHTHPGHLIRSHQAARVRVGEVVGESRRGLRRRRNGRSATYSDPCITVIMRGRPGRRTRVIPVLHGKVRKIVTGVVFWRNCAIDRHISN
jgi:hypothetical protein